LLSYDYCFISLLIKLFNLILSMSVDPENPLLIEILTGSSTSYAYNPAEQIVDVNFFPIYNNFFKKVSIFLK